MDCNQILVKEENHQDKQNRSESEYQQINNLINMPNRQQAANYEEQKNSIDQIKYEQLKIVKVDEHELKISPNLVSKSEQSDIKPSSEIQQSNSKPQKTYHQQFISQQLQNDNIQSQDQPKRIVQSVPNLSEYIQNQQCQQLINDFNDSDNSDIDEDRDKQKKSENDNKTKQKKQQSNKRWLLNLKSNILVSVKYLLEIMKMKGLCLILVFILSISIVAIQANFEIDKNCDLKELVKPKEQRKLNGECPIDSYLVIGITNIVALIIVYIQHFLLFMNIYQFAYKRLIQYGYFVLLTIVIILKCIIQSLNQNSFMNIYTLILMIVFVIQGIISRHSINTIFYRLFQVVFYLLVLLCMLLMQMAIRDNRNFYASLMLQHFTFIIKKVNRNQLQQRLKYDLQYDDITIIYISTIVLEYMFIFDYLLIQNNSYLKQLTMILNFMVIQIYNISNTSVFYEIYIYFQTKSDKFFQGLIIVSYSLIIATLMVVLVQQMTFRIYFILFASLFQKLMNAIMENDSRIGRFNQLLASRTNGYFEQKINQNEIDDFGSQQSIIAYLIFSVYQLLLVVVQIAFPESNSTSNQYYFIHQFKKQPDNNLSLTNVLIFNLIVMVIIFAIIVKKNQQNLRIVKQPTKYQPWIIQFSIILGFVCLFNKAFFTTANVRQQQKL